MSYAVPYAGGRHRTDRDPVVLTEPTTSEVVDSADHGRAGRFKNALRRIGQGLGNYSADELVEPTETVVADPTATERLPVAVDELPERLPTRREAERATLSEVSHVSSLDNVLVLPSQPCFDVADVLHLAGELDDRLFPWRFAGRYREQLDQRVDRIEAALEVGDLSAALEVTLSLKVTSALVGTRELAELATVIEGDLRAEDLTAARQSAAKLSAVAGRASDALSPYLSA